MNETYLAFGSNLGDRKKVILTAIDRLLQKGLILHQISSLYETMPYGYADQPVFLNCVASFLFGRTSFDLLKIIQGVENELGRKRGARWGPRNIDIDILLFARQVIKEDHLTVPHYDIQNRLFFLLPLTEVAPDIKDPRNGLKYKEYAERLMKSDADSIRLFTKKETLLCEFEELSKHYI
ncbi:MAG: 2-amino-4-hydroxy-6-hydroxymethyldihydropteridine diphosphokinase [Kosmotogaceae bacterium]